MLITNSIFAQNGITNAATLKVASAKYDWKHTARKAITPTALCFISGFCGGLHEGTLWKPDRFKNQAYWNHWISYTRPRFLGAARDGYHDMAKLRDWFAWGSGIASGVNITIPIVQRKSLIQPKRPAWQFLADVGINVLGCLSGYALGQLASYDILLH